MMEIKRGIPKLNLQLHALQTFTPDNVLLMNAKNGSIPQEEGTLVLKEFMNNSVIMQLAKVEPMTTPIKNFTYLASGPGAYWVDEAEVIQTDKATWLDARMEAKKLGVIIPVSKEFLNYTVKDFFAQMRPAIAEAFYTKFDQAALFGVNTPYAVGTSVWERINAAGNVLEKGSTANLYTDLNGLLALVEDGDNDPNGFTTTKKFRQHLRGAVGSNNLPIFNDAVEGATASAVGLPIGYADSKSWDYTKADLITGDWEYARYGILQNIEYSISEDATLSSIVGADGKAINLFERDMFALRATMWVAFMTLKDNAFAALTPNTKNTQVAPTGLVGVKPTTVGGEDGTITGTTIAMEYRFGTSGVWTTATATTTTVGGAGDYQVRLKETNDSLASPVVKITIPEGTES